MKQILSLTLCLFLISHAYSQFKLGLEYRARSEFKDGLRQLSDSSTRPALVTTQRARLKVDYSDEKLDLSFQIQDVRAWGEIKHIQDVPSLALHEASARYQMTDHFAFKLGRQQLVYDKKRLLGAKNWNNISVAHDVALFIYQSDKVQAHGAFAYNNDTDKLYETDYPVNYYKYLSLLWFEHDPSEQFYYSLINYYEGYQKAGDSATIYTRGTVGGLVSYKLNSLSVDASIYYQYGTSKGGQEVSAYFFHAEPAYKIANLLNFSLGIDYFSGDDALNDNGQYNSFSNPYGDGHGYYGLMDYFTTIDSSTKGGGLNDMFAKVTYTLNDKMTLHAAFHNFRFTNNVLDISGAAANKQLGNEIDIQYKYNFYKKATFLLGYSTMLATESMEIIKGGDASNGQNWLYASIQFKPEIFNSNHYKKQED